MVPQTTSLGKLITYDIYSSIKQNQSLAWHLGPQALGKLRTYDIYLSIKQNQSLAWHLRPQALGKLRTYDIYSSIKQNQSLAWLLEPQALGKLITYDINSSINTYGIYSSLPSYLTEPRPCLVPQTACFGQINTYWHLL